MTGKTHKAVGVCVGIAFTYWGIKTYSAPTFAISTIAAATGAMLPDIDHSSSRLGAKRKLIIGTATKVLSALFGLVVLALSITLAVSQMFMQLAIMLLLIILPVTVLSVAAYSPFVKRALKFSTKHRGIMHTLAIPLLLCLGSIIISNSTVRFGLLAMAAGYTSHLFLDCFNKRGCPILWPVVRKNIALLRIRTGSRAEYVFSYSLTAIFMLVFLSYQSIFGGGLLGIRSIPVSNNQTFVSVIDDLEKILTWHDKCAGYYEDTLTAIDDYIKEPTEDNLNKAKTAGSKSIGDMQALSEISHSQSDEKISEMNELNLDVATLEALFDKQSLYKNEYIANINRLLFYVNSAPDSNTELEQMLREKQKEESEARELNYFDVNYFLVEIPETDLSDFKNNFLPSLNIFKGDGLSWEKDKAVLESSKNALPTE